METTPTPETTDPGPQPKHMSCPSSVSDCCILSVDTLSVYFNQIPAIADITLEIPKNQVTAIIGPSGGGKSTLLKQFNRMNDFTFGFHMEGQVTFHGQSIYEPSVNTAEIRRRIGMVYQKPNVFSGSVYENIAWAVKLHNLANGNTLDVLVEQSLRQANLWGEVKDRLAESALNLSGGQQQRLCIARALAVQPDVLLMDEPCSALDPVSTGAIESLLGTLREQLTIVLVTHDLAQAKRVSNFTAFLENGQLIEFGQTSRILKDPQHEQIKEFIEASRHTD